MRKQATPESDPAARHNAVTGGAQSRHPGGHPSRRCQGKVRTRRVCGTAQATT